MGVWIENTGMLELLKTSLRLAAARATFVRVTQRPILAHEPGGSDRNSQPANPLGMRIQSSQDSHDRGAIMPFRDRVDAGRKLARALRKFRGHEVVVLALPRGGVPVAAEVAAALHAPLDLILVRKIGVPMQPELAMGAVVDGPEPHVVRNDDVVDLAGVSEEKFAAIRDRELLEIERRRQKYLGDRPLADVAGRVAIVIDDGIATGATIRAALQAVRPRRPKCLVLAVPVAPSSTLFELRDEADELVCLEDHESFGAIGFYYRNFRQVDDQEVMETLARFPATTVAANS
jgi:predicted phosphoribosyltransferase